MDLVLVSNPKMSSDSPPQQPVLERQNAMGPEDFKLARIKARVVKRPVRPKRNRSAAVPVLNADGTPRKRVKFADNKPAWLKKDADLEALAEILSLWVSTDEVYVDLSEQEAPYNVFTLPIVRHLAKKARQFPEICVEWNVLGLSLSDEGSTTYKIPLNGRNSTRNGNAAKLRAYAALQTFSTMGFEPCTANVLKDLGFGSKKATEYLKSWSSTTAVSVPLQVKEEEEEEEEDGADEGDASSDSDA